MLRKQHFARFYRGINLYSIKAKAVDKLKSWISSSMTSFPWEENISVFYGFTETIVDRFLTNQSERFL
mgnify:CR=1 FL=1